MLNGEAAFPYDSEEARALAGAITAIMTVLSYKTSAEMAKRLVHFPVTRKTKHMMRVMRIIACSL
jgi:ribonucleoside-diphosphate reductase alpha chain